MDTGLETIMAADETDSVSPYLLRRRRSYAQALRDRAKRRRQERRSPPQPEPAADDPVANYLADIFTLSTSLAGLPGMSIPCGFGQGDKNAKRPVGLQIIGNYFDEAKLLNVAHQYQLATDWHRRAPEGI